MARFLDEIEARLRSKAGPNEERGYPRSAAEMLEAERARQATGRELSDLLTARDVVLAHLDPSVVRTAMAEARTVFREQGVRVVKTPGEREVTIQLGGGSTLCLWTPYLRPTRKGLVGRPRGSGKRREGGAGVYPVLEALGIVDRVTPLARSEVARQTVLCSSYEEAQEQLRRMGLVVAISTITRIAVTVGVEALALRDQALAQTREVPSPEHSPVAGKRIRVSVDGGRARTRRTHRTRKKKNGRRPFTLQWKEPRLVTVDVLDDNGDMDRDHRPIYEVSLGNADEVFALLTGLLRMLGAKHAAEVVFVSDGAEWIWTRLDQLVADTGIPAERFRRILDYYHATEHVSDALDACKNLSAEQRRTMLDQMRRLLLHPEGPAQVVARLRKLARGRRGRKVNKEIRYLDGHLDHMRYAELRDQKVPIGSGVVESAVRRVLNFRFKAASMCWRTDHLLPLLYLRAALKSGRWDDLIAAQLDGRHWLTAHEGPALRHQEAA